MDNCGGASWFVLLAAEKNEQINDLSTPLLWNYRSFGVSPILLATPRKATGHGRGGVKGRSLLAESFFCLYTSSEIEEI